MCFEVYNVTIMQPFYGIKFVLKHYRVPILYLSSNKHVLSDIGERVYILYTLSYHKSDRIDRNTS